jgi:hypothetical protein
VTGERRTLSIRPDGSPVANPVGMAPTTSQFEFLVSHAFIHEHAAMAESLAIADPRG